MTVYLLIPVLRCEGPSRMTEISSHGIGPYELTTFEDAAARTMAQMIATKAREYPATKITKAESVCITATAKLMAASPVRQLSHPWCK